MDKEKKYSVKDCTPEELEAFNKDLFDISAKHSIRLFANPFIKEGKVEASLVAMKITEVQESTDGVKSPFAENGTDTTPTKEATQ